MPEGYIALSGIGPKTEGLKWESECLLRIGRQASLEVVLRDTSVDRLHAEVKFHGQRWMLKDLADSAFYPTLLNGNNICGRAEQLCLNDLIQVGNLKVRVSAIGFEPIAPLIESGGATPRLANLNAGAPRIKFDAPTPVPGATRPGVLLMTGLHRAAQSPSADPELQVLEVQASTRQSWDQALEQATIALSRRPNFSRAILSLLRANHHLSSHASLDELLDSILADVLQSLDAQRAAILLADPRSGQLELKAILAPSPITTGKKAYSRTIAQRSFHQGESLLCRDVKAGQDPLTGRSGLLGSMSSVICALVRTPGQHLGVLHVDRGPLQEPFVDTDLYLADAVAANVAVGIECAQLVAGQSEQFLQTVTTLARAVEMRDQYTALHTRRVTDFALLLADDLNLSPAERYQIRVGTPLHDIGKIGVDDAILRKPGKLTDGEFEHMKLHTIKGAAMLDRFLNLAPLVPIIRSHHEHWDGTGYPDKIARDNIALPARIVAIADTFEAMTSQRPYRPALPPQIAFLELLSKAGTHFDPHVVQSFVKLRSRVEEIMRAHHDAP
jgi:HD-GYP domain-containing protein (c-di-GMP phosphodiesterase class II)